MNRKVFFSYSWKDMKIAMRLYDDLSRSHLSIWRDQIDGDPTADFKEEFLSKIDECDDFLILDSVNYRTKSNWCIKEIERCFENRERRNGPRIIVCLLDEDGEWRKQYKDKFYEYYFSKINLFKYFSLYYSGIYDNDNVYQQTLNSICSLFSERYVQWNSLPSDRDLEEEISASSVLLTNSDRLCIINAYKYICRQIELGRDVSNHFKLWIDDCKLYQLDLFFPTWTYCIWLGQDSHNGAYYEKCFNEFKKLSESFPSDPRSFRGLGCISARIGRNDVAVLSLQNALNLMQSSENSWHRNQSEIEVLANLGQIYINCGEIELAIDYLYKALYAVESAEMFDLKIILNLVYCLFLIGNKDECKNLLLNTIKKYPLEGELYAELGKLYSDENNHVIAYEYFNKAFSLKPSIENAFYLLSQKVHIDSINVFLDAEKIVSVDSVCMDDDYWKGAICFYIIGDLERSLYYYQKCDKSYAWYK